MDEILLRPMFRSPRCEQLLQTLEMSPVSDVKSLEALVDLVRVIKDICDKPPVRVPRKKREALQLLEMVHPVIHADAGRLLSVLPSSVCARVRRRLGLPHMNGGEYMLALIGIVAAVCEILDEEDSAVWKIRLAQQLFKNFRGR